MRRIFDERYLTLSEISWNNEQNVLLNRNKFSLKKHFGPIRTNCFRLFRSSIREMNDFWYVYLIIKICSKKLNISHAQAFGLAQEYFKFLIIFRVSFIFVCTGAFLWNGKVTNVNNTFFSVFQSCALNKLPSKAVNRKKH